MDQLHTVHGQQLPLYIEALQVSPGLWKLVHQCYREFGPVTEWSFAVLDGMFDPVEIALIKTWQPKDNPHVAEEVRRREPTQDQDRIQGGQDQGSPRGQHPEAEKMITERKPFEDALTGLARTVVSTKPLEPFWAYGCMISIDSHEIVVIAKVPTPYMGHDSLAIRRVPLWGSDSMLVAEVVKAIREALHEALR